MIQPRTARHFKNSTRDIAGRFGRTMQSRFHASSMTPLPPVTRRTLLIGDVQGEADALKKGLEIAQPGRHDRICFLGDLIEGGPDSRGCVEIAQAVQREFPDTIFIDGNHDEKHRRVRALLIHGNWKRLKRIRWTYRDFKETHRQLSDEQIAWLETFSLVEKVDDSWVAVHAGIPPQIIEPIETIRAHAAEGKYKILRVLTYLKPDTLKPYKFNEDQTHGIYWAEEYDGRYGHILFGHQVHLKPTRYPWAIALDTGSGWGGRLSILELLPGESNPRVFSISTDDLSWGEERLHEARPEFRLNHSQLDSGVQWD